MYKQEYQHIFDNERSHFYFRANHEIILSLIRNFTQVSKPKILDAGCGTGYFAMMLKKIGPSRGIDLSRQALAFAKKNGAPVTHGSIVNIPYQKSTFDVVTTVDVINHLRVRNPQKAFDEFFRVLKPGGILVLRVPGNPHIHLTHDVRVHTHHRWSMREVKDAACQSGFKLRRLSYVNMLLLPAAYIVQLFETLTHATPEKSSIAHIPHFLNSILASLLALEKYLLPHISLPFGLGIILVAQKPYNR